MTPEHGTPAGYDAGCHGAAECTNHRTGLMTCTEAHIRYQGDYAYRKAVDAGTATAEPEVFLKAVKVVAVKKPRVRPKLAQPAKKVTVKRDPAKPQRKAYGPRPIKHGTPNGALRCKDACPSEAAGGLSCKEARRDYQRTYMARRRAGDGPPVPHGTTFGYDLGCHKGADCPKPAGETCADVVSAYGRDYNRTKKANAA